MKIYDIALFLFIFNTTLAFLNSLAIFEYSVQPADYNISDRMEISALSPAEFLIGLKILVEAIAKATILLPAMLKSIGFPDVVVNYITAIVWFVYVAGVVQFIIGRQMSKV